MRSSPVQVGTSFYRVLAASSGLTMIDPYGTIRSMGDNTVGQIGSPTTYSWRQLSNGDAHSFALRSDGVLYAWGLNTSGQLGVSDTAYRSSPVQVTAATVGSIVSQWTQVSAGASHTLAIANDGIVYGWGLNTSGQIGDLTVVSRSAPVQVGLAGAPNYYNIQFNGSNYLNLGGQANFAFPLSTDFTVEMWLYPTAYATNAAQIFDTRPAGTGSAAGYYILSIYPGGGLGFGGTAFVSGGTVKLNEWSHVAATRQGTSLRLFLNGVQVGTTVTDTTAYNVGANRPIIGTDGNVPLSTGYSYIGYISNIRVVKGTAVYTAGFTPSASVLTQTSQGAPAAQVSLLTAQNSTIVDSSTNAFTITNTGSVAVNASSQFAYYSGSFNGTSQCLELANTGGKLDFGTGDFTIEMWLYCTANPSNLTAPFSYGNYASGSTTVPYFEINGYQGRIRFVLNTSGTSSFQQYMLGPIWTKNTWYHFAVVRSGNTITTYGNGTSYATLDVTGVDFTGAPGIRIGAGDVATTIWSPDYYFPGYISNLRIVKGTAVYTGNFTAPTNILRTIQASSTNTVALTGSETLLLTLQNSTIIDNSVNNFTFTNGGSVTTTASVAPYTATNVAAGTGAIAAISVSAGKDYSIVVQSDNTLWSWGINNAGQLGNAGTNLTVYRSSPVQVGTSSWSLVSAGASHALALNTNNLLYGWGLNSSGQVNGIPATWSMVVGLSGQTTLGLRSDGRLFAWGNNATGIYGINDRVLRSSPIQVGTRTYRYISEGHGGVAAIASDYTLWTWGYTGNNLNTLLDSTASFTYRSSPVQVSTSSWSMISMGGNGSPLGAAVAAITVDGKLHTAGASITLGDQSAARSTLAFVNTPGTSWSTVSASGHILGIQINGTLWAWGLNTVGQLGQGDTTNRSTPVQIAGSWTTIATGPGGTTSYGIKTDGTLWGWGNNANGQLGQGDTANRSVPAQINIGTSFTSVTTNTGLASLGGAYTMFAVDTTNRLWWVGFNWLVDGTTVGRSSLSLVPKFPPEGAGNLRNARVGQSFQSVLTTDGRLFAWGYEQTGFLGTGDTLGRSSPIQIGASGDPLIISPVQIGTSSWSAISAGASHSMAITGDNRLFTWGSNTTGQLGYSATFPDIAGGTFSSLAIRNDGSLWAWGRNNEGQLADGTTINRSSPVQVGPYTKWKSVANTGLTALAIRDDGTLWGWGYNASGQLLQNDTVARSSPVQVSTSSWTMVTVGGGATYLAQSVYAIRTDGALFTWGANDVGQLGLSDVSNRSSPVQVGSQSWLYVSAGVKNVLAIRKDYTLWAWGVNNLFQLGLGDTTNRNSPTQVGTSSWTSVTAGFNHAVGVTTDNVTFAWGGNAGGQLGDGSTVNRSTPTQIGSRTLSNSNAYSTLFDGSSYYTFPGSTINNFSSNAFTIEMWVYHSQTTSRGIQVLAGQNNTGGGTGTPWLWLYDPVQGQVYFQDNSYSSSWLNLNIGGITTNQWHHMAICKDTTTSDNIRMYIDGVQVASRSGTVSADIGSTGDPLGIGGNGRSTPWLGYITNVRITKNQALYAINQSFMPSTSPLATNTVGSTGAGAASNLTGTVSVLTAQSATIRDNSGNNATPTITGVVTAGQIIYPFTGITLVQTGVSLSRVEIGESFTIGIGGTSLYGWGLNNLGQLGLGDSVNRSAPVQIPGIWTDFTAGNNHVIGINNNGLYVWGVGDQGQHGDSLASIKSSPVALQALSLFNVSSPVQVGAGASWSSVAAGLNFSSAIRNDGALFNWGFNTQGQTFYGSTITRSSPTQMGTYSYSLVSAGGTHLTYVKSSASTGSQPLLLGSGFNTSGQVGDLSILSRSSPVQVAASLSFERSPKVFSTGDYTSYYSSSPVQIGTSSWNSVSAGGTHTIGLNSNGLLFAWGRNTNGQLGVTDTINRSSPVQIGTSSYVSVSAGDTHNIVAKSDGSIFGIGKNDFGQLGDGT